MTRLVIGGLHGIRFRRETPEPMADKDCHSGPLPLATAPNQPSPTGRIPSCTLMYFIYAALAFAEVFVLFASAIGFLVLVARGIVRASCKLKNKMKDSAPQCALKLSSSADPCWVQCRHRLEPRRT